MKELVGCAVNHVYTKDSETKAFVPWAEIVLMLNEPKYELTDDGVKRVRSEIETFRFAASQAGIGILLKSLIEVMERFQQEAEVEVKKESEETK